MTRRPYPTRESMRVYLTQWRLAEQDGRICVECGENISDVRGGKCVGCRNRDLLAANAVSHTTAEAGK